jgi:L-ascorbate metabolism protein UlaG (beta-lactamase superfamily)
MANSFKLYTGFFLFLAIVMFWSCKSEKPQAKYQISQELLNAPPNFFNKSEEYIEWQTENLLNAVEEVMQNVPAQYPEVRERHLAMLMLDAVFHDVTAPHRPAVQRFHHERTAHAIREMKETKAENDLIFWKLYDMALVVRTASATIAFDLTRGKSSGSDDFALPETMVEEIINMSDALFISHYHRDHADKWVVEQFIEQGKPVIAPHDVFGDSILYAKFTHIERKADEIQSLTLPTTGTELKVVVYPGHQGSSILNNMTLITTPEGFTFCHTGDQSNAGDFDWIDGIKNHFDVDILFPNCWTTDPPRMSNGVNPKLIVPLHENELGHTIDHREAYALNYSRWDVPFPKLIMGWGESYKYIRE